MQSVNKKCTADVKHFGMWAGRPFPSNMRISKGIVDIYPTFHFEYIHTGLFYRRFFRWSLHCCSCLSHFLPFLSRAQALVLLQAALGGLPLEDWTLRGEQTSMLDVSARLLACCAESLAVCGRGGGLGCAVALRLTRSVRLKIWMDAEVL